MSAAMYNWVASVWSSRAMGVALASLAATTLSVVVWERHFAAEMGGLRFLDTYAWLTPAEKYSLIEAFGSAGRGQQVRFWAFGSFHSIVEYSTAALSAIGLTRALSLERGRWRLLVPVAGLGLLVELLENAGLLVLLAAFPGRIDAVAWTTTCITVAKFSIKLSLWGCLLALLAAWLARRVRASREGVR